MSSCTVKSLGCGGLPRRRPTRGLPRAPARQDARAGHEARRRGQVRSDEIGRDVPRSAEIGRDWTDWTRSAEIGRDVPRSAEMFRDRPRDGTRWTLPHPTAAAACPDPFLLRPAPPALRRVVGVEYVRGRAPTDKAKRLRAMARHEVLLSLRPPRQFCSS